MDYSKLGPGNLFLEVFYMNSFNKTIQKHFKSRKSWGSRSPKSLAKTPPNSEDPSRNYFSLGPPKNSLGADFRT